MCDLYPANTLTVRQPMILMNRTVPALLWLALLGYALLPAPPAAPDTAGQVLAMLQFDSSRADPLAIAVFNLLGVLPAAFMALILFDAGRPNPWPFAVGAFVLGGFVLLPYLVVRDTRAPLADRPGTFARIIGSRTAGVVLLFLATALIGFALIAGSPSAFLAGLQSSKFIAVMTADLLALTAALHVAAATDRRRRGIRLADPTAWAVHVPLLGPLLYLALRPQVPSSGSG
jgi:hypothetical protein